MVHFGEGTTRVSAPTHRRASQTLQAVDVRAFADHDEFIEHRDGVAATPDSSVGMVVGTPRRWLRVEGGALVAGSLLAYSRTGASAGGWCCLRCWFLA